ncbi:MAG: hypothetical protein V1792_07285 [Pseudomonadota bacterium]
MYPISFEEHQDFKLKRLGCESKGDGSGICYWLRRRKRERLCGLSDPPAQICWIPICPFELERLNSAVYRQEQLIEAWPVTTA